MKAIKVAAAYPTSEHAQAARAIVEFFSAFSETEAVILMGSCARGKASRDSCLDILILLRPEVFRSAREILGRRWEEFYATAVVFQTLRQSGKYSHVDLEFVDGHFEPRPREWTSGPDEFELAIGNTLAYTLPLWERGDYFAQLRARWLPYYDEPLRRERLAEVLRYCYNNLGHIPPYVGRGLYFQAFKRLYDASREFLQVLFISRRTYPIAYDKWIREQVEEILGLPELYAQLPRLFEIQHFESDEIARKGEELERLVRQYVEEPDEET
jgi:predicted nucleotidyltransferase